MCVGEIPLRQHVGQARQRDQLAQLAGAVPQHHPAAMASGGELEARQRVDGDRVGDDVTDVAQGDLDGAVFQQPADAGTEPGQVGA